MAGPLKTLFGALKASMLLSGVTLVFGDEEANTQRWGLPAIVMIARGGPISESEYSFALDPVTEAVWGTAEQIDFWLWNCSTDPANQGAIDHTDSIEALRLLLLSALRDQRAQYTDLASVAYGLIITPLSGRWETIGQNAVSKYGRAYVLTAQVLIPIPQTSIPGGPEATITSTQQTEVIIDAPSG